MFDARFLKNSMFFGISLLCIQGATYLLQLLAASQMDATNYSVVRLTESSASVGALLISFGVPSAILVFSASARTGRERASLVLSAVLLMLAIMVAIGSAALLSNISILTISLAAAIALRLLLSSTTQARQSFRFLASGSILSCAVSFCVFFGFASAGYSPFMSWMVARFALELLLAAILLTSEASSFSDRDFGQTLAALKAVAALAAPLGASLAMRALVEHGPIIWLVFIGSPAAVAAEVGLVITIGTIALVPATVVQSVLVPKLARDPKTLALKLIVPLFAVCGIGTSVVFVGGLIASTYFVPWALATPALAAGAVVVVLAKMAAGISGGLLLVLRKGTTILVLNTVSLAIGVITALLLTQPLKNGLDATAIIWSIAAIESIAATLYLLMLSRHSGRTSG